MDEPMTTVARLHRQQAALARFGSFAFRETNLQTILDEAARICAESLNVPYAKLCRYRPAENDLLVEAGHGWRAGVVGHVVSRADSSSPQGRAFSTGRPVIVADLQASGDFILPAFYAAHGIVSTVDVIIKGNGQPYGVLEIDSPEQHTYDEHDVDFLTGFANVLAEAVVTAKRTAILHAAVSRMEKLVAEKDVLVQELQHRVRNNLQLVYGMLEEQLREDPIERDGVEGIARRVMTLAEVYNHLLGTGMSEAVDFGDYVTSLCANLREMQGAEKAGIALVCHTVPLGLDLDSVTVLGIVAVELVSNSYAHAFADGRGTITVELGGVDGAGDGLLTISDDGTGFGVSASGKRRGLPLMRRLMAQIGGTLEVRSDHGVTCNMRFRVAGRPPHHAVRPAAPPTA
jgi:two-component sensor histidine kinase